MPSRTRTELACLIDAHKRARSALAYTQRHYANMDPKRRAKLEREWK